MVSAPLRLLVVGGTGFLGRAVCRAAVGRGIEVTSISRSEGSRRDQPAWAQKVEWQKGDALQPDSFRDQLEQCHAVVHTVGTLMNNRGYKTALGQATGGSQEDMGIGGTHDGGEDNYTRMNVSAAKAVAEACTALPNIESLVYVSTAGQPPGVSPRYVESKREAEAIVLGASGVRSVVLRPGFMYSEDDPVRLGLGVGFLAADFLAQRVPLLKETCRTVFGEGAGAFAQALPVDVVGEALVEAAVVRDYSGCFDTGLIRTLARNGAQTGSTADK